jgi:hypothetical protein
MYDISMDNHNIPTVCSTNWLTIPKDIMEYIFKLYGTEIRIMLLVCHDIRIRIIQYFPWSICTKFDLCCYGVKYGYPNIIQYAIGANDLDKNGKDTGPNGIWQIAREYIGSDTVYFFSYLQTRQQMWTLGND